MKATLSPRWELSTDHAASHGGAPVLVDRDTGDAYGPGDILQVSNSWGFLPAARVVARLAQAADLDTAEQALVDRFVVSRPSR
jgi:hypothetical protein